MERIPLAYRFYFSPNDIILEYQTGSEKRAIKIMQLIDKTNEENDQVNVIVYDPSLSIGYGDLFDYFADVAFYAALHLYKIDTKGRLYKMVVDAREFLKNHTDVIR